MTLLVTLGEIVVDFLAAEPGAGFRETLSLRGPFPAGAPAIFADQAALLGCESALISCVGADDFGAFVLERLRSDGVDVSAVTVDSEAVTGTAFVRYHADGGRDFLFNIATAAPGRTRLTPEALRLLDRATQLHIMGSSLISPQIVDVAREAIARIKARGAAVSFDPNARKEMLGAPHMRDALDAMLAECDLFLPSGDELYLFTQSRDEAEACGELLARGVAAIVVKDGSRGARYYDGSGVVHAAPYAVAEIDATGAGDCFGATFVTCRLLGYAPEESLRFANAAGALAVTREGAMAGSSFADLRAFMEA